jgi:hypothetical protein
LGISKQSSAWSPGDGAAGEYASVPDAWIFGDGFAILVESKVAGDFSPRQMQAHIARLQFTEQAPPRVVRKTWPEIHSFFRHLLPSLTGAAKLLAEQFVQYLEYSEMSGFTGFRREHFEYFLSHDDDDARRWVRAQFDDFAGQVLEGLNGVEPFYERHEVGVLRISESHCWAAFGPTKYRNVTHQTISIASDGLRVFVNAELKRATDRIKAVLKQSADTVREALCDLHEYEPFDLVLQERTQKQASLYDYTPKMQLHSSLLADESAGGVAWMAFVQTVQRLPLPYLRIERLIPPSKLVTCRC